MIPPTFSLCRLFELRLECERTETAIALAKEGMNLFLSFLKQDLAKLRKAQTETKSIGAKSLILSEIAKCTKRLQNVEAMFEPKL